MCVVTYAPYNLLYEAKTNQLKKLDIFDNQSLSAKKKSIIIKTSYVMIKKRNTNQKQSLRRKMHDCATVKT